MCPDTVQERVRDCFYQYRVHCFVFLLTVFIALTLAHPAIVLNDEFITTNQLHQLQAGHQIVVNEGKYGLNQNGSMSGYFGYRSNVLGYSLFLPLLSLPAYKMIQLTGENFVYFILVLWTVIALLLILFVCRFFPEFSTIYGRRWTSAAYSIVFILFFVNLHFYSVFPIDPVKNYPEIIAIVFTNIILLGISSVLIYEINHAIFSDRSWSFFGTAVCLLSSSYFFWSSHCKDHILVLFLFCGIFLCLIYYIKTNDRWFLPLSFVLCGTLAWVRPELALWIGIYLSCIVCYAVITVLLKGAGGSIVFLLVSPLFVFIGALPFFLNNYLVTKNIFLPAQSLYLSETAFNPSWAEPNSTIRIAGVKNIESVIWMFAPTIHGSLSDFFGNIIGIFVLPNNFSVSIMAVIPLFFSLVIVAGILFVFKRISLSDDEKKIIRLALGLSVVVVLTYFSQMDILNTDPGILPDIRYYIPLYLCLIIIGLVILRSANIFYCDMKSVLRYLAIISVFGVGFSLLGTPIIFSLLGKTYLQNKFFSLYALSIVILTSVLLLYDINRNKRSPAGTYLVLLLCSIPFFWQVSITVYFLTFSRYAGYIPWIPVVRVLWQLIVTATTALIH